MPPLHACECDTVTLRCIHMSVFHAWIFGDHFDSPRMAMARLKQPKRADRGCKF